MFAFGIWEQAVGRLSLVRDRLGIKPLYYFEGADFFIFGSEIRALLASGLVPRRLSRVGVESFLSYGSVEDPLTIIEGIYAVLPGHRLGYRDGRGESRPYWEIRVDDRPKEDIPKEGISTQRGISK
jgi:asparagine synthase (glutamine-hydrolysing)